MAQTYDTSDLHERDHILANGILQSIARVNGFLNSNSFVENKRCRKILNIKLSWIHLTGRTSICNWVTCSLYNDNIIIICNVALIFIGRKGVNYWLVLLRLDVWNLGCFGSYKYTLRKLCIFAWNY